MLLYKIHRQKTLGRMSKRNHDCVKDRTSLVLRNIYLLLIVYFVNVLGFDIFIIDYTVYGEISSSSFCVKLPELSILLEVSLSPEPYLGIRLI